MCKRQKGNKFSSSSNFSTQENIRIYEYMNARDVLIRLRNPLNFRSTFDEQRAPLRTLHPRNLLKSNITIYNRAQRAKLMRNIS